MPPPGSSSARSPVSGRGRASCTRRATFSCCPVTPSCSTPELPRRSIRRTACSGASCFAVGSAMSCLVPTQGCSDASSPSVREARWACEVSQIRLPQLQTRCFSALSHPELDGIRCFARESWKVGEPRASSHFAAHIRQSSSGLFTLTAAP
jgi:hypothetical protein